MPISGGYLYLKRDHSTDGYNSGRNAEDESSDMDNNRCEISDCQRSFSEGRLIDRYEDDDKYLKYSYVKQNVKW